MTARVATSRGPVWRPFTVVHDWAAVLADLTIHEPAKLLLGGVDPAVAGWHADAAALREGFARIETVLHDALPADGVLVWATNTTRIADQLGDPPRFTQAGNRLLLGCRQTTPSRPATRAGRLVVATRPRGRRRPVAHRRPARLAPQRPLRALGRPAPEPMVWATLQMLLGLILVRPLYRRELARG